MDARRSVQEITDELSQLIARPSRLRAWEESRRGLEERLHEIERKADAIEKTLVVLMVGGTGVGKSTLLNALAKEPIAAVSDAERAYTSQLNLYHHEAIELTPLLEGQDGGFEAHGHTAEALRDKIIIDAPDVDSIEEAHRRLVAGFLPRVDLVLYLTTWQKYKNQDVCEFVAELKGSHFFMFVLNQIDVVRSELRAELVDDFRRLLGRYGFDRPLVLGISARNAVPGRDGDSGDFDRLEDTLRNRIRAAEIRMIKESGLLGRLRTLVRHMLEVAASGSERTPAELREALLEARGRIARSREQLTGTLVAEIEEVIGRTRARFERRYHELRDRDVGGPYGLFLRLQAYLGGEGVGGASLRASRASLQRQSMRIQATISRTLEGLRASLRPLGLRLPEVEDRRADALTERLLDAVRRGTDETYLAALPPARSALTVNAAPTATLLVTLALFLYLAATGAGAGLVFLVAGLLLAVSVCYAQYAVFRTADRRAFHRMLEERAVSPREVVEGERLHADLVEAERHVEAARSHLVKLEETAKRIGELRSSVLDLPEEVRQ